MSATVVGLALLAAFLHAAWNAFLRSGGDRLRTMTVMSLSMMAVAVPFAIVLPLPAAAAWPYLLASSALQLGYSLVLIAAYGRGELGQVYPLVRGTVPLLVTFGGALFAGERLAFRPALGVALVALGMMSLAWGNRRTSAASIPFALMSGALISVYVTVDALGVRESGSAGAYAAWICLLYGALMLVAFRVIRGPLRLDLRAPDTVRALLGGAVSLASYAAVIAAFALGPAGPISALRETSVVFAALIGGLWLGEAMTAHRLASCAVVALGAVCIGYPA